jgi:hypothetical protein
MGKGILHFDQEPGRFVLSFAVHADQCEPAPEFLAVQGELQLACGNPLRYCLRNRLVYE